MQKIIKKLLTKKGSKTFKYLFCAYVPFLFFVTLMPGDIIKSETEGFFKFLKFENADKVVHFLLFFFFVLISFMSEYFRKSFLIWAVPIAAGILIEFIQEWMSMGRTFDWFDILSNSLGVFLAYYLVIKVFNPNLQLTEKVGNY